MKAIILAAGRGTRLASMDLVVPKPMVRVRGIPVLEHTIEHFDSQGIRDITITIGHLHEVITDHFGDGRAFGVRIRYSPEDPQDLSGTAGGVKRALSLDSPPVEPVLIWHGDNFSNCRIDRLQASHELMNADVTIVTRWRTDLSHSGAMAWNEYNRITEFEEKPENRIGGGWINSGMYLISPEVIPMLPDKGDFARDVFPQLIKEHRVFAHGLSHDEFFRWYDTPGELMQLRKDYK